MLKMKKSRVSCHEKNYHLDVISTWMFCSICYIIVTIPSQFAMGWTLQGISSSRINHLRDDEVIVSMLGTEFGLTSPLWMIFTISIANVNWPIRRVTKQKLIQTMGSYGWSKLWISTTSISPWFVPMIKLLMALWWEDM